MQYSVFEADVTDYEYQRLLKKMDNVKLGNDDSIRVYRICGDCVKHIKIWGVGEVTEDRDFYIA